MYTQERMELIVCEMLQAIGESLTRTGLRGTPKRVVESWRELFSGYKQDPAELFTVFEENGVDGMVILKGIEFVSFCEHHLMPFTGRAHIGYIPRSGKVIGVSKLARLLDCFAKRLQIQERIGLQVTHELQNHLNPYGCGCVLEAVHSCVSCRGVGKQHSVMVTSSMRGCFFEGRARDEFLRLIGV